MCSVTAAACALVTLAISGTQSASAAPARPTLLDEPPRLFTFKLDDPASPKLSLLRAFQNAEVERPGPLRRYLGGPWGQWRADPWQTLSWSGAASGAEGASEEVRGHSLADGSALIHAPAPARDESSSSSLTAWIEGGERLFGFEPRSPSSGAGLRLMPDASDASMAWLKRLDPEWSPDALVSTGQSFASNGFDALWAAPVKPVPNWRCRRRPVTFMRYGSESASFELVRCDGSVAPAAADRLSIMARPPEAPGPGPGELLPDEPAEGAWAKREWLPQIRLVNPRLLWVLQRIADAFPWRSIYIYSGYRPKASKGGSHHSLHSEARAMDISVMGVPNVSLFELCRTLEDVGCGYYPNSKFVHVDVRRPGTGHALWIDASGPGEPSRYVDSWPGVMTNAAMAWDGRRMAEIEREEAEQQERPNRALPSTVCSDGPEADRHSR